MKLTIERLGHLGDGIAQGPDGPVYVSGILPGEEVEGELNGDKLENLRILTPSAERVKPACSHAKACGGCLLQHASDQFVADWKTGVVAGAMAGQGVSTAKLRPIITSPARSRRRATLTARRTKGGVLMGFHSRGSDNLVQIPNCQLLHPDLMATFAGLEALVKIGGSRSQELQINVTRALGGADLVVRGGKPLDADLRLELARAVESYGFARLTWISETNDVETVALRDNPVQMIGRAKVTPPAGAFLQATDHGEKVLIAAVQAALGPQKKVVDLFAGCGTFSLPLAESAEVIAVEGDGAMLAALDKGARQAVGLRNIRTETRDLFRRPLEPDEFKGVTGVVIDPPRAGAEAQIGRLAEAKVPVIAMVSCNPVTFARDAKVLVQAGYKIDWVQIVDQFRWSAHIELVAKFTRA